MERFAATTAGRAALLRGAFGLLSFITLVGWIKYKNPEETFYAALGVVILVLCMAVSRVEISHAAASDSLEKPVRAERDPPPSPGTIPGRTPAPAPAPEGAPISSPE